MKTNYCIALITTIILLYSCRREKDEVTPEVPAGPATYADYSQLKAGNYWIYQRYMVDTSGNETPTMIDSCYVQGDTVINGNTYYIYSEPAVWGGLYTHFLRDSLHYILDFHRIVFSSHDYTTVFGPEYQVAMPINDTICSYSSQMTDINLMITVPAGNFTTLAWKTSYTMYPPYNGGGNHRSTYSRYAENKGLIEQTLPFYSGSPNHEIRKLLRYHLN